MDFWPTTEQDIEFIYSPKFSYLILACVVICLAQFVESSWLRSKRVQTAQLERQVYYTKLEVESLKKDQEQLDQQIEMAKTVGKLKQVVDDIKNRLSSCESESESNSACDERSLSDDDVFEAVENEKHNGEMKIEAARVQLLKLKTIDTDMNDLEHDIRNLSKNLSSNDRLDLSLDTADCDTHSAKQLTGKLEQLELENTRLKAQIDSRKQDRENKILTVVKKSDLDPKLIEFVEQRGEELTLDFLERAYDTLLDIKAAHPDKDFATYIRELQSNQIDYVREISDLRVSKKQAEKRLEQMQQRYQEELSSFNETKIEYLFKNCGQSQYYEKLREINTMKDDMLERLKADLDSRQKELVEWRSKFENADRQCNEYWKAWRDTQAKKDQIEAERRAAHEHERLANSMMFNKSLNMSSASSMVDNQVPPPPPIHQVPLDQILSLAQNGFAAGSSLQSPNIGDHSFIVGSADAIPPPPAIEVPIDEILSFMKSPAPPRVSEPSTPATVQQAPGPARPKIGSTYGKIISNRAPNQ